MPEVILSSFHVPPFISIVCIIYSYLNTLTRRYFSIYQRPLKTDGIDETDGIIRGMGLRHLKMGGMGKMGDVQAVMTIAQMTVNSVLEASAAAEAAPAHYELAAHSAHAAPVQAADPPTGNMMGMMMRRRKR